MTVGTHIQIRDVPDDIHQVLVERAKSRGQSLADYLREELALLASHPELAEVTARAARRKGGASREQILEAIRAGRDR